MNDLQDALTGALNEAAHEGEVHIERLLTGARAAGLRYRRRRRILVAGGSALAALVPVVLVAAGLALYRSEDNKRPVEPVAAPSPAATQAPTPTPTTEAARAAPPQLPILAGVPSAQKAASTVGRGAFHVGVGELPFTVATMQWTSDSGLERVLLTPNATPEPTRNTDPTVATTDSKVTI